MVIIPTSVVRAGTLFQEGICDVCVYVLLLQCAAVVKKDVGIKELEPCCLTETSELIMDEAIVDAIELVDIIDDLLTLISNKFLYERVSADGDSEANHAVRGEHG